MKNKGESVTSITNVEFIISQKLIQKIKNRLYKTLNPSPCPKKMCSYYIYCPLNLRFMDENYEHIEETCIYVQFFFNEYDK